MASVPFSSCNDCSPSERAPKKVREKALDPVLKMMKSNGLKEGVDFPEPDFLFIHICKLDQMEALRQIGYEIVEVPSLFFKDTADNLVFKVFAQGFGSRCASPAGLKP